ncbi:MAG: C39 family peptidase [Actinobacteria bacterium]|nr:C39 family peptidase [Actinomycetota bacterium]
MVALASLLAVAAAIAIALGTRSSGGAAPAQPPPPAFVRLELGGTTVARAKVDSMRRPAAFAAALQALPSQRVARVGRARITYAVDQAATAAALHQALRQGGGTVTAIEHPIASTITVPLIKQRLRDDCEATALSMVLGYAGRPVDQLQLQREVAHAKPLDPTTGANGEEVWGDPSLGFVGRADGGGPAGGFGVYQGPIRALAQSHGLAMTDLTGRSPNRVYAALLAGHPVLAWVALSPGPFASWASPAGRTIRINWGEHAVVLTGLAAGTIAVNDPLSGERLSWTTSQFESMWAGLGHRALAA